MTTRHELINPETLGAPKGYSNGVLAQPGRLLFVAGMVGWDQEERFHSDELAEQFGRALENVLHVVHAAGGRAEDICRLTVYVTDKRRYLDDLKGVGAAYRRHMGKHFPAMALVEVAALVEDRALVEIEGTAVIPEGDR